MQVRECLQQILVSSGNTSARWDACNPEVPVTAQAGVHAVEDEAEAHVAEGHHINGKNMEHLEARNPGKVEAGNPEVL
jgi:hypothetical protein